jgi:hypothetical protein
MGRITWEHGEAAMGNERVGLGKVAVGLALIAVAGFVLGSCRTSPSMATLMGPSAEPTPTQPGQPTPAQPGVAR